MTKGRTITSGSMVGGSAVGSRMVAPPGPPLQRSYPDDSTPRSKPHSEIFVGGCCMGRDEMLAIVNLVGALEACADGLERLASGLVARNRCLESAGARVCAPDSYKGFADSGPCGSGFMESGNGHAFCERCASKGADDPRSEMTREIKNGTGWDVPGDRAATPGGAVGFPDGGDAPACAVAPVVREST